MRVVATFDLSGLLIRLEEVILIVNYMPASHPRLAPKLRQQSRAINKLERPTRRCKEGANDGFVLDGVERAGRVSKCATNLAGKYDSEESGKFWGTFAECNNCSAATSVRISGQTTAPPDGNGGHVTRDTHSLVVRTLTMPRQSRGAGRREGGDNLR